MRRSGRSCGRGVEGAPPCRINRTIVSGATHEQWVYGWYHCLYFDNGVLTAIQD